MGTGQRRARSFKRGDVNARVVRRNAVVESTTNLSRLQLLITRQVVPELEFLLLRLRVLAKRMEAFLALLRGLAHRARRTCGLGLPFVFGGRSFSFLGGKVRNDEKKCKKPLFLGAHAGGLGKAG